MEETRSLAPVICLPTTGRNIQSAPSRHLQQTNLQQKQICMYFRCGKKDADKGKVQEIRDYVKSVQGFRQVELTAREQNYGLAKM